LLLGPASCSPSEKRIGIIARSEALDALLRGLLAQWHYAVPEQPVGTDVLLVEEGCLPPGGNDRILWLTRSGAEGSNRLNLPLQPEALWRQLGKLSRNSLRNHIRITVQLPATLRARSEYISIQISSLSDLGTRFDFPRELVNGEQLTLHMVLEGEGLALDGRVIYVIPRGDAEGTGRSEVGMIFDRTPPEKRNRLREYIIWRCLDVVRRQVPKPLFVKGLEFFQLPQAVLRRLEEPVIGNP